MTRFSKILISFAAMLTLAAGAGAILPARNTPNVAMAATTSSTQKYFNQDDITATTSVGSAWSVFAKTYSGSDENYTGVDTAATTFKNALTAARAKLGRDSSDKDYLAATAKLQTAIDGWVDATNGLTAAISSGDSAQISAAETALNSARTTWNNALDDYDTMISGYNSDRINNPLKSGDASYIFWYIFAIVAVICLIGAIVMNVATRNQHGTVVGKNGKPLTLKGARRNIIIGAAVFVAAAAFPLVQIWQLAQHGGGTYYFSLWLPVFGAVLFIGGLVQYISAYSQLKKAGALAHRDNAAEMASTGASITVPKIGEKIEKK